jgi:hypothetical protein
MIRRFAALTVLVMFTACGYVHASDDLKPAPTPIKDAAARVMASQPPVVNPWPVSEPEKRPAALTALYGTYGAIQVLDIVSTRRAIAAGAQERNPLMRGGSMGTMLAMKAAASASTIFFAERMWKKNRVGAVIVMAALNGASAAIVAHNQRNARR